MDSSSVNPTQVSFSALDSGLHGLVIKVNPTQVPSPFQMQSYTDSLSVNPTHVSFLQRCSFTRTHHQSTLHRCPSFQDAVLHELIISQPYTGVLLSKMQLYTSSTSGNPTQVPSFNLQKLHLQMASISPSTCQQSPNGIYKPIPDKVLSHLQMESISPSSHTIFPNGIYKPIPDKVLSHLQMASISPSSYPPSLQMASVSLFPPSHC